MKFINTAKPIAVIQSVRSQYGFDEVPILLFQWSKVFQAIVSQAATKMFTGKYHTDQHGIYKVEGGCNVGVGDLVLSDKYCYFDGYHRSDLDNKANDEAACAALITRMVLSWGPNDPVVTLLKAAAEHICVDPAELKAAIEKNNHGSNVFSGDALADFFRWNPFCEPPYDADYRRWCLVEINKFDPKEVDQKFNDEALGKRLMFSINSKRYPNHIRAMCCSPRRMQDGTLLFWVNTGGWTQLDGWQTQESIEKFLASGEVLADKRNR